MISLVDETFKESRSISDVNKIVGNAEKSNGRSINRVTVSIKIAKAKDRAKPKSKIKAGTGNIIIMMTAIMAKASRIVG